MTKMLEDLLEEDSLRDELAGSARCHCGRFAKLTAPPRTNVFGQDEFQVDCSEHGKVWVS